MTTRTVETPNPATPSASFPLVPLLKPASGNLTLTATINRDLGDDTPTLVTVKNSSGPTLASTIVTTPSGSVSTELTFASSLLDECSPELSIDAHPSPPPVVVPCCPETSLPATLAIQIWSGGAMVMSSTLTFSDSNSAYNPPPGGIVLCPHSSGSATISRLQCIEGAGGEGGYGWILFIGADDYSYLADVADCSTVFMEFFVSVYCDDIMGTNNFTVRVIE